MAFLAKVFRKPFEHFLPSRFTCVPAEANLFEPSRVVPMEISSPSLTSQLEHKLPQLNVGPRP